MFGKLVHLMIEEDAQGGDWEKVLDNVGLENEKLFSAEKEMYGEILEDIRIIMREYFAFWPKRDLVFLPWKGSYAEHEFAIPIDDDLIFKGQIDAIAETPQNYNFLWLVENKTFKTLPSDDHRWRNLQHAVYTWAMEELGINGDRPIAGVAWNYIKSKPPTIPQLLKDGSRLSKKKLATLPSVIYRELEKHSLSAEKHQDLIAHAEASRESWFQRIYTPLNRKLVDNLVAGFFDSGREMSEYHETRRDQSFGRHCEWCDYESICRAELTGGDADFVKEKEFKKEDPEAYRRSGRDGDQGTPPARKTALAKLGALRKKRNR